MGGGGGGAQNRPTGTPPMGGQMGGNPNVGGAGPRPIIPGGSGAPT